MPDRPRNQVSVGLEEKMAAANRLTSRVRSLSGRSARGARGSRFVPLAFAPLRLCDKSSAKAQRRKDRMGRYPHCPPRRRLPQQSPDLPRDVAEHSAIGFTIRRTTTSDEPVELRRQRFRQPLLDESENRYDSLMCALNRNSGLLTHQLNKLFHRCLRGPQPALNDCHAVAAIMHESAAIAPLTPPRCTHRPETRTTQFPDFRTLDDLGPVCPLFDRHFRLSGGIEAVARALLS